MNETDDRLIRLSTVLQTSVAQMLSEKMARQFKKKNITPATFSKRLFDILESGLKSEQEATIHRLTSKVESLYREKETMQQELATERRRFAHENSIIVSDTTELQRKYNELDGHYKSLGWRRDQREQNYQSQIQSRERVIRLLRKGLLKVQTVNRYLTDELRNLREFVTRFAKQELRLMRSAHELLATRIQMEITQTITKQKKKGNRRFAVLETEFRSEKLALDQLRGASQLLLDSVWHLSSRGKKVIQIPVEEIPRRIAEVHSHIRQSIEDQKQIAIEEVRRELSMHLPEIEGFRNRSLTEAVISVFSERLTEKENELTVDLKAAQNRERKMKRKLESVLSQVQSITTPVKLESPVRKVVELEGIEELRDDWEIQRKQLDLKMSELTRGMSSSLENHIFRTPKHERL
jgi:hypothetical protein